MVHRILLPILCYHHVGVRVEPHGHRRLWVSAQRFAEHMSFLSREGYQALTLRDCVPFFATGQRPARPTVVLTFDDAYVNFHEFAVPILREHGFAGTVFVTTGEVGGTSRWDEGFESATMGWDHLREIHAGGIECASHTVTHPRLTSLTAEQAGRELADSRAALEDKLGAPVRTVAYPFGDVSQMVAARARDSGYELACTIARGNRHPVNEPMMLRRVPMDDYVSIRRLAYRLRPLYDLASRFKRFRQSLRDRVQGTPAVTGGA